MQILAMYLPQFHRVKENDEWWGDGFTDWISTQKATELFENHYQPHIPLNNNYYDLLQKETMIWQANLMKQYGVDGICMYHYWFKEGKQILEKPAKNLLSWKDIDMPYCFCWANETWARSWARLQGANAWADKYEDCKHRNGKAILLEQAYGDEEIWKKHFIYLNHFFKDKRYIKIDGKPLFLIYRANDIYCLRRMVEVWEKCAIEVGWKGLYIIGGYCNDFESASLNGKLICEPGSEMINFQEKILNKELTKVDYSQLWEFILENEQSKNSKTYYSGFVGYDDTPRRGEKGTVVINSSPELFRKYMTKLLAKSEEEGNEITFINAWNEWGEGMHLEPDEKYQYSYLQALKQAKIDYPKYAFESDLKHKTAKIEMKIKQADKNELYMNTLDIWLQLVEDNIYISKYLEDKGYIHIGIYGYGMMCRHFIKEMEKTKVKVDFLVDMQKEKINIALPVFLPNEELPVNDAIVVTSFYYYDEIKNTLPSNYNLISLRDIIYELKEQN